MFWPRVTLRLLSMMLLYWYNDTEVYLKKMQKKVNSDSAFGHVQRQLCPLLNTALFLVCPLVKANGI